MNEQQSHGLSPDWNGDLRFNIPCICGTSFSPAGFITHLKDSANDLGIEVDYPETTDDFEQWRKNIESRMREVITLARISTSPQMTRRPPPPPEPPKTQQQPKGGGLRPVPLRSDPDHKPSCGECQFTGDMAGFLVCQRNPPQVVMVHNPKSSDEAEFPTVARAMWPRVESDFVCGEFIVRWHPR